MTQEQHQRGDYLIGRLLESKTGEKPFTPQEKAELDTICAGNRDFAFLRERAMEEDVKRPYSLNEADLSRASQHLSNRLGFDVETGQGHSLGARLRHRINRLWVLVKPG